MEAAETLKNDDSGGSDREDTASKASDSSMHSPHSHSRSFSNGEQNNNKISMGNHNSSNAHSPQNNKEQHKSPSFRSCSPGSVGGGGEGGAPDNALKSGPQMNLHHSQLPPPHPTASSLHNGKSSVLSPPPPGLGHHHHHHHNLHPNHMHNSHPLPLHSHLMHPGISPTSSTRTTPPTLPLSLTTSAASNGGATPSMVNTSPSHLLAHHPNGLPGAMEAAAKGMPPTSGAGAFHPESDPEAFRWVHNYSHREPISMIR